MKNNGNKFCFWQIVFLIISALAGTFSMAAERIPEDMIFPQAINTLTDSNFDGTVKIYVPRYHSRPFQAPLPVERISIGEPGIADVVMISPEEFIIHGKNTGSTTLMIWYRDTLSRVTEKKIDAFEIRVTAERPFPRFDVEVINGIDTDEKRSLVQWEW